MTPEKLQETQQYIDFIQKNLEPLAEHLKVGVEWLWQILVQQVRVEAIVYLAIIVLMTIKASILLFIAYKSFKKAKFGSAYERTKTIYVNTKTGEEVDWDTWYDDKKLYTTKIVDNSTNMYGYLVYWCGISGIVLTILVSIITAVAMPKIVTGLVNPEYGAIERIVQFSKGQIPNQGQ